MQKMPSEQGNKVQSQDTALKDYSSSLTNHRLNVMKKFGLLGLTAQQQRVARGMILKEADTFTTDDTEIGGVAMKWRSS